MDVLRYLVDTVLIQKGSSLQIINDFHSPKDTFRLKSTINPTSRDDPGFSINTDKPCKIIS